MKANSNLAILDLLARQGCGFDIVSGGELARALAVGADPQRIVFSGVGKTRGEIDAALAAGIRCFNVESEAGTRTDRGRGDGARWPRTRVGPRQSRRRSADASVHLDRAEEQQVRRRLCRHAGACISAPRARPHLQVVGIDCHIGSQITELAPYLDAADRILDLVQALRVGRHRIAAHRLRWRPRHPAIGTRRPPTAGERDPWSPAARRCARPRRQDA